MLVYIQWSFVFSTAVIIACELLRAAGLFGFTGMKKKYLVCIGSQFQCMCHPGILPVVVRMVKVVGCTRRALSPLLLFPKLSLPDDIKFRIFLVVVVVYSLRTQTYFRPSLVSAMWFMVIF